MIRVNEELADYVSTLINARNSIWSKETYPAKTLIIKQDSRYSKVHLIRDGIAKCYISDENGKEFIQEFLGQGMEFGELEVFDRLTTICSVESITALHTVTISHSNYQKLLDADKTFNKLVIKALSDKIRFKAPRHSYQHGYPIEANLIRLKETFPEFISVIPKKDIANYIGITGRSLNRALKELKAKSALF
ncbi:Crp/Fnr family transcriptional regulator [Muricauda sp. 2012CJ35-5]|uniref:Crp/Fnr family transcriptional regulator n=1 Tax=Flagellimonas spongiicola TaxID=2942208 RepID=A0ABT0PPL3_9FLAO|nr:Crp/Fnr family transcriptional regulator [Allomuricauda spongiicola]MCL6273333.1 Crp/Fnr family transcriptional regulator [Allomuricauda spongiicola]